MNNRLFDWIFKLEKKYFIQIILLLVIIILINVILIYNRQENKKIVFDSALVEGDIVSHSLLSSKKETILIFLKASCENCIFYQDSIIDLYDQYKGDIDFVGLYNPKYIDSVFMKKFEFKFVPIDNNHRKVFHLAVTPQIVSVNNNCVTFSSKLNLDFDTELNRLRKYLINKYKK